LERKKTQGGKCPEHTKTKKKNMERESRGKKKNTTIRNLATFCQKKKEKNMRKRKTQTTPSSPGGKSQRESVTVFCKELDEKKKKNSKKG